MSQSLKDPITLSSHSGRWQQWREWELVFLVLLTLGLYASRLTDLSIRGEESRRGRIAWEMVQSGDWLVPRVQGLPRLSRPPLQYWTIAVVGILRHQVDAVAVRLPSVLATLLTVILIYAHGRCWMSRTGAFASGAMYATFAQVLQLGRLGETEAIFTCLLSSALLLWHIGLLRKWNPTTVWTLGYLFAGLATLAKGPQAPVYFAGGVGLYLLLTRQWRFALSGAHAAGIALYVAVVGAWQVPFSMALGQERVSYVYMSEVAKRFEDRHLMTFISHLAFFPVEVWLGCLFPWSLLLLAFASPRFRQNLGNARQPALFLAGCIAIAFPTVWIPPEARTRYFMPLFPCFALLCGCVLDRWTVTSGQTMTTRVQEWFVWLARPQRFAVLTCVIGLIYVGPLISFQVSRSRDASTQIDRVKNLLPPGTQLSSFGVVHHLFSFHYADAIAHHPWPTSEADVNPEINYFCIDATNSKHKPLPFEWEEIIRVNCDRNERSKPECEVIVARRVRRQSNLAQRPATTEKSTTPDGSRSLDIAQQHESIRR